MAVSRRRRNIGYGIGQPLIDYSPLPISSTRVPTANDIAEIGTLWVNTATNAAYILTSVVANTATWTTIS